MNSFSQGKTTGKKENLYHWEEGKFISLDGKLYIIGKKENSHYWEKKKIYIIRKRENLHY